MTPSAPDMDHAAAAAISTRLVVRFRVTWTTPTGIQPGVTFARVVGWVH